jgi:Tol biopolymer transport system component
MTTSNEPMPASAARAGAASAARSRLPGLPVDGLAFDRIAVLLAVIFVGGVYLDGWAHNHGKVDQTFFTPWHAVLYSGYAIDAIFLLVTWLRLRRAGRDWRHAMPAGYGIALVGAAIFAVGGVLDLIWHTLFGIEADVQALLSPTHLLLATGLFLMLTGPLRAAWARRESGRRLTWAAGAPALLALALVLSLFTFFTQFAHPLVQPWAAQDPRARDVQGDLYVMHADGSRQTRLTTTQHGAGSPTWSPDGALLAFQLNDGTQSSIWVMRADGSDARRLTPPNVDSIQPAWSPDGKYIAYVNLVSGASRVMLMRADGRPVGQIYVDRATAFGPAWSPDGTHLVFESNLSGDFNLYSVPLAGGPPVRLTRTSGANDFLAAWSPDGRQIAFTSTRDGTDQLYLMNVDGSGQHRLTSAAGADARYERENWGAVWSPDGTRLAFVSTRDGAPQVYQVNADGSHPINLSRDAGMADGVGLVSWSRAGDMLAYGAAGRPVIDAEMSTSLGIASILLQAALFSGVLLFALRRWSLPLGTVTLLLTLSAILVSFMADQYRLVPAALLAGICADVLLLFARPGPDRVRALRVVAFAVPAIYFLWYLLAVQLTFGVAWVIHLWLGAPVMAGILGLFVSYLVVPPGATDERAA